MTYQESIDLIKNEFKGVFSPEFLSTLDFYIKETSKKPIVSIDYGVSFLAEPNTHIIVQGDSYGATEIVLPENAEIGDFVRITDLDFKSSKNNIIINVKDGVSVTDFDIMGSKSISSDGSTITLSYLKQNIWRTI